MYFDKHSKFIASTEMALQTRGIQMVRHGSLAESAVLQRYFSGFIRDL